MNPFVDFVFYKEKWSGSLVDEAAFSRFAIQATYEVDRMTFGRVTEDVLTDDIRFAVCAVIEKMHSLELASEGHIGKKSETVGNYSVTFDDSINEGNVKYRRTLRDAAYPYLSNTGLLYKGVM